METEEPVFPVTKAMQKAGTEVLCASCYGQEIRFESDEAIVEEIFLAMFSCALKSIHDRKNGTTRRGTRKGAKQCS